MFKPLNALLRRQILRPASSHKWCSIRTFLAPSYYCKEVWENRLKSPIFQKVNLDVLYYELDQRFQKTRQMSAVDVDIFANAVKNDAFIDELMDLVHKLRLSAETGNTLPSTPHAVIRILMESGKEEVLLEALNDRLNYGIFLDDYTANLLLDIFWKSKNFVAGCRVASQLMLQEDFSHPVSVNLSLLHCYNYLLDPQEWPLPPPPEEPEAEVKVRVKYIRNPYDDNHFDLKDPMRIVGKTLMIATANRTDPVGKSFNLVGIALFGGKIEEALESSKDVSLVKEIIDLLPEDNEARKLLGEQKLESRDIQAVLQSQIEESVAKTHERDIADVCNAYTKWETLRYEAIEEQKNRVLTAQRLAHVAELKKSLEEKEQKLWFFEKEEDIELGIEELKDKIPKETEIKVKSKTDEEYIPPEIIVKRKN